MFGRLRAWWRETMNLDGPWWCVACGTRTVVRVVNDGLMCIGCGRSACTCDPGGWGSNPWTDPDCEHHGSDGIDPLTDLERRALELSRRR